jgi:hypothetical protein
MWGGVLLIVTGVWLIAQTTRGNMLGRLRISGEPTIPGQPAE